jgi:hypothetical protein
MQNSVKECRLNLIYTLGYVYVLALRLAFSRRVLWGQMLVAVCRLVLMQLSTDVVAVIA